jgi:hypothetical protein
MRFDDDLKWARLAARGFLVVNLVIAAVNAYGRNWFDALGCLIWAGNCGVWLLHVRAQQRTRDQGRILEAAVLGTLRGTMDIDG